MCDNCTITYGKETYVVARVLYFMWDGIILTLDYKMLRMYNIIPRTTTKNTVQRGIVKKSINKVEF